MNNETTKQNWSEIKSQIKSRFGKLTDESIESAKENLDLLTSKLQSAYGYAKDQAEKELANFKKTLNSGNEMNVKSSSERARPEQESTAQEAKPAMAEGKPAAAETAKPHTIGDSKKVA